MCSCSDGRWKLGKFISLAKNSFITWSALQEIELPQSCINTILKKTALPIQILVLLDVFNCNLSNKF